MRRASARVHEYSAIFRERVTRLAGRRVPPDYGIFIFARRHTSEARFLAKATRVSRPRLISTPGNKWDHQSRRVTSRAFHR